MLISQSAVVNYVRLQFYTSVYGALIKLLLHKNASLSMTIFRHSTTLINILFLSTFFIFTFCSIFNIIMLLWEPQSFQLQLGRGVAGKAMQTVFT